MDNNGEKFRLTYLSENVAKFYIEKALLYSLFTPPTFIGIEELSVSEQNIKIPAEYEFKLKTQFN